MNYSFTPIEIKLDLTYSEDSFVKIMDSTKQPTQILLFSKANNAWYFRFSGKSGKYTYQTATESGSFTLYPYKGTNPLFLHGPIQVSEDSTHLVHADNTPFFYLADTWWYGATNRMPFSIFQTLTRLRKKQGFSAVQTVVGIPPETTAFSKDSKNEGGHPFLSDYTPNKAYFDALDKRIMFLLSEGIVPVIFGGWGHHIDFLGVSGEKRFWREIMARYGQYPVIFSLSGEIDAFLLPPSLSPKAMGSIKQQAVRLLSHFPPIIISLLRLTKDRLAKILFQNQGKKLLTKRIHSWNEVGSSIQSLNTGKRPITAHIAQPITARDLLHDPAWLTVNSIQSGHEKKRIFFMEESISQHSKKLIINLEPWYEGITGDFLAADQRKAFWFSLLSGAKGHSYGAHGIWQMATKKDPFLKHWGVSDYQTAMNYDGAQHIGQAKRFLTDYPWWKIRPNARLITLHFEKNHPLAPVAGSISDSYYFVYFPKGHNQQHYTLDLPNSRFMATWYDPKTMKSIHPVEFNLESVLTLSDDLLQDDLLLMIKKA